MEECICYAFSEYYDANVDKCHEEGFEEDMVEDVTALLREQFEDLGSDRSVDLGREVRGAVDLTREVRGALDLFRCMVPLRTSLGVPPTFREETLPEVLARCLPAFAQRTPEWYAYRRQMMTASNIYKAIGSEAEVNQLIVEKCSPPPEPGGGGCVTGSRHHGVKYEPLSVEYYERTYDTKVAADFSCVPHPRHPFIGASPDGVNVRPESPLYGRMLEVKNTVSREITGNPKREYWVQMQVQMEVLGLEWCDLLETRFAQYTDKNAFDADGTFSTNAEGMPKGVILQFFFEGAVEYAYSPWGCSEEDYARWDESVMASKGAEGRTWASTIYWKLEEVHCSLVRRNPRWFESHFPAFKRVWDTIQVERESGAWALRLPKKRPPKLITEANKCLLDISND
jgi:putative phage-type endonuclease